MTVGVYGLVAGIVKLDDAGLHLSQKAGQSAPVRLQRQAGQGIIWTAPYLMKALSIAGTAAMFLVGGGILTHGMAGIHEWIAHLTLQAGAALQWLASLAFDGVVGIFAGAVILAGVTGLKRLRQRAG